MVVKLGALAPTTFIEMSSMKQRGALAPATKPIIYPKKAINVTPLTRLLNDLSILL